jgi:hypothetical protein
MKELIFIQRATKDCICQYCGGEAGILLDETIIKTEIREKGIHCDPRYRCMKCHNRVRARMSPEDKKVWYAHLKE